jgi:hypothetical protein
MDKFFAWLQGKDRDNEADSSKDSKSSSIREMVYKKPK